MLEFLRVHYFSYIHILTDILYSVPSGTHLVRPSFVRVVPSFRMRCEAGLRTNTLSGQDRDQRLPATGKYQAVERPHAKHVQKTIAVKLVFYRVWWVVTLYSFALFDTLMVHVCPINSSCSVHSAIAAPHTYVTAANYEYIIPPRCFVSGVLCHASSVKSVWGRLTSVSLQNHLQVTGWVSQVDCPSFHSVWPILTVNNFVHVLFFRRRVGKSHRRARSARLWITRASQLSRRVSAIILLWSPLLTISQFGSAGQFAAFGGAFNFFFFLGLIFRPLTRVWVTASTRSTTKNTDFVKQPICAEDFFNSVLWSSYPVVWLCASLSSWRLWNLLAWSCPDT